MEPLNVAAAIIRKDGSILIAQRLKDSHMGLKWEFPGGKIEPGEDVEGCLKREIKEELYLEIEVGSKLMVVKHQYDDVTIILHCHWCSYLGGEAKARYCRDFKWVTEKELKDYDFADADQQVVKMITSETLTKKEAGCLQG